MGALPLALPRCHRVIGELQVGVIAAGIAALMAIDDVDQAPMHAGHGGSCFAVSF